MTGTLMAMATLSFTVLSRPSFPSGPRTVMFTPLPPATQNVLDLRQSALQHA